MRAEAVELFDAGEFVQSQSTDASGQRFDKPGVHALELDGDEWDRAGWLLEYTSQALATLPAALNSRFPELEVSSG